MIIRRARPADRDAVLRFCRRTWGDYGDFVHLVWDNWVADRRGFYAIASLGERPIATAKLTLLRPGELWFEGLRVDREFRGTGLAQALTEFLLKRAGPLNARSIRYATSGDNFASRHIGETWGFRVLRRYTTMEARADGRRRPVLVRVKDPARALRLAGLDPFSASGAAGRTRPTGVAMSRGAAIKLLTRVLTSSRFGSSMKGLASEGWTFHQVNEDFVGRAVERGELYVARKGHALPAAGIVLAAAQRRRGRLLVWTLADLREGCLPLLLAAARRLAFDMRLDGVRVSMPYERPMTIAAYRAGYHREYPGMSCVVMEHAKKHGRSAR